MDTLVIGTRGDDDSSESAIALGLAACATVGAEPVFVNVYPTDFDFPGGAVDPEWRAFLRTRSDEVLAWARLAAGDPPGARYLSVAEPSNAEGLTDAATSAAAVGIVIGSAHGGVARRLFAGTTADRLFHGSPVPVLIAPPGYAEWAPKRFTRIVVAYQGTADGQRALAAAARTAEASGASLHLVTILERVSRIYGGTISREAEEDKLDRMATQAAAAFTRAADACPAGVHLTTQIIRANDVASALAKVEWRDEDILMVGSGRSGLLRRVFLGDVSYRIVHGAEVPCVVVPRSSDV